MNSEKKEYIISLEQFEGPLDLLHQLIEQRKLQINTISLAKITEEYMAHVREMEDVQAEEVARFMYIASILILIKSKSLLPMLEYTKEEETDVAELEDRITLFEYIRTHAVPALRQWKKSAWIAQPPKNTQQIAFNPDNSCTLKGLRHNAEKVLQELSFLREPPRKKGG